MVLIGNVFLANTRSYVPNIYFTLLGYYSVNITFIFLD